jgi:four helix bundle protein
MKCASRHIMSRDHRKLKAFHLADTLAVCIYRETINFPPEERYGLQSQLRRAAVSIPANIVEGSARRSDNDYVRLLEIALSSACEVDYLIELSRRLLFLSKEALTRCKDCSVPTVKALQRLITVLSQRR